MDPPSGFTPKEVCKLKNALYKLKKSPRAWFGRLSYTMKGFGYKQAMMVIILLCLLFMLMT